MEAAFRGIFNLATCPGACPARADCMALCRRYLVCRYARILRPYCRQYVQHVAVE